MIRSLSWRLIEWSLVMGGLCWLFVYLWIETPDDQGRGEGRDFFRHTRSVLEYGVAHQYFLSIGG